MNRFKFTLSYFGGFQGSQKRHYKKLFLVESRPYLKNFKQPIRCIPAGRTDAGVHASEMVFHADFDFDFSVERIQRAFLRHLSSEGILLRSIDRIAPDFHALTSAKSRTYDYLFTFDSRLPHYLAPSVTLLFNEPNFIPSSEEINRCFTGLRNWSSLSNISDVPSVIRRISDVSLTVESYPSLFGDTIDIYRFKITADGFLYRMVRHIVGILLHSMLNFTNMDNLIDYICVNRPVSYTLAPAQGLHLTNVTY